MDAGARHQARERALALLYEADAKGVDPAEVLAGLTVAPDPFTAALVTAVSQQRGAIDAMVEDAVIGWRVDRLATVDRNVLRLAVAELEAFPETPTAVVLDEAVELATAYSTEDSGRFVNGVLAAIAARVRG